MAENSEISPFSKLNKERIESYKNQDFGKWYYLTDYLGFPFDDPHAVELGKQELKENTSLVDDLEYHISCLYKTKESAVKKTSSQESQYVNSGSNDSIDSKVQLWPSEKRFYENAKQHLQSEPSSLDEWDFKRNELVKYHSDSYKKFENVGGQDVSQVAAICHAYAGVYKRIEKKVRMK